MASARAIRRLMSVAASASHLTSARGVTGLKKGLPGISCGVPVSRSLFVKIDTTPNPDSLKFVPEGREVLPEKFGNGVHYEDETSARGSKLARRLLKHKEITGVYFGRDFISVNKKEEIAWNPLKPIILDAVMDAYAELDANGTALVEEVKPSADTVINDDDDEVVAMIKELLETRIRPAVQEDGGDIYYLGFDSATGTVKVKMAGSCVGCPSSTATLRDGIEKMLMHYIPEVKAIEQIKGEVEKSADEEFRQLESKLRQAGLD